MMTKPDFTLVTPEWIAGKLESHKLSQTDLADMVNMSKYRLNCIIRGRTDRGGIGGPTQAALFHFFQALELQEELDLEYGPRGGVSND